MPRPPSDHWARIHEILAREVPEVAAGAVELRAVARAPGRRTKLAVTASDPDVDAVGVCVGNNGRRADAIAAALGGERVDLLRWSDDPMRFVRRALAPALVQSVELDLPHHRARAYVRPDELQRARGENEENQTLATELTGWSVEVVAVDASG